MVEQMRDLGLVIAIYIYIYIYIGGVLDPGQVSSRVLDFFDKTHTRPYS